MSSLLTFAIIAMTIALISYTLGVWGEKRARTIKPIHLMFFWFGLVCDILGTEAMRRIAKLGVDLPSGFNLHGFGGAAALGMMAFHTVWATITYIRHNPHTMRTFHRYSLGVWSLWLVPFVSGVVLANFS